MKKKRIFSPDVILVDGSSQFYRAYFQLSSLINSHGMPTGAIYGFTNIVKHIIDEFEPQYIAIAWDSHRKIRSERFSQYKATRTKMPDDLKVQIPYIKRIVSAYGIPTYEYEGYEADDIIATVVSKISSVNPSLKILIVTSDKDITQIVSDSVWIYDPRNADEESESFYSPQKVKEKYGVRPEQIPDYIALVGDQTDNIPGVRGIGPEGAKKLLERFGTVEEIFQNLNQIEPRYRSLLLGEKQNVLLYKELAKLKIIDELDVKLEKFSPNIDALIEVFKELEFSSHLRTLSETYPQKFQRFDKSNYFLVDSEERLNELISKIEAKGFFSIDCETTSLNPVEAEIVGISIAFEDLTAYYIEKKEYIEKIRTYIEDNKYGKIGHNIKYDIAVLKRNGINIDGIKDDSMVQAWLLNPDRTKIGLDELSLIYLGHKMTTYKEITADGRIPFKRVNVEKAKDYSCEDAIASLKLSVILKKHMQEKNLIPPYENIELKVIPVLADMELAGVKVDKNFLIKFGEEIKSQLQILAQEIYGITKVRFNIDSPQQLSAVLFERMKIQLEEMKRTKKMKMYSTDNEVLQEIASEGYEIGNLLLKYRSLKKLLSTYIQPLPMLISPKTQRIHSSFNQTKTATGRISSSDPNLQNIPSKGEEGEKIRLGFIADEGNILVSADYSQIELRVLAHLSGDPNLIKAFEEDKDIHSEVASALFGKDKITKDERRIAKIVNFGIIYGISPHGLKIQAKLKSRHDAQKLIDSYFEKYQKVKEWRDKIIFEAERQGFVKTISGRLRYIPELKASDKNIRSEGERRAVNTPVQGSAADIMKIAMIKVHSSLKKEIPQAKIIMQIHDEIIIECPEGSEETVSKILLENMKIEEEIGFSVPLKINIKVGRNWAELD